MNSVNVRTFDNGLSYIYQHIPEISTLSLQLHVFTGSAGEHVINKNTGIAHVLEHTLFNGTGYNKVNDIHGLNKQDLHKIIEALSLIHI